MRNRFRIVIGVLVVAVLCGICWLVLHGRDHALVYQGKTIEQYLDRMAKAFLVRQQLQPPQQQQQYESDIKAVHAMGPEAIPYLRRALRRKESFPVRGLVFLHAGLPKGLGDRLPVPPTPEYLSGLAVAATACLAAFGPVARSAVPDLLDIMDALMLRNSAYGAVMEIGVRPEDLPQLLAIANGANRNVWPYAAVMMGSIGVGSPPVITALTNLASKGDVWVRAIAIRSLGELGPQAAPAIALLNKAESDPEARIRIIAAGALWRIEGRTNAPLAFLLKEFEAELDQGTPPSSVQNAYGMHEQNLMEIIGLLKELGAPAQPAVPLLHRVRTNEMILVRFLTTEALWTINQETNGIEPMCLEGLAYHDSSVQVSAAKLLSRFCIEQHSLSPVLINMMTSTNGVIQFHAARALWKINGETDRTVTIFTSALQSQYAAFQKLNIRQLAAESLGEMGPKARSASSNLVVALKDGVPEVRAAAAEALKKIDPQAAAKNVAR